VENLTSACPSPPAALDPEGLAPPELDTLRPMLIPPTVIAAETTTVTVTRAGIESFRVLEVLKGPTCREGLAEFDLRPGLRAVWGLTHLPALKWPRT
jgi:hypothetical protein